MHKQVSPTTAAVVICACVAVVGLLLYVRSNSVNSKPVHAQDFLKGKDTARKIGEAFRAQQAQSSGQ